MTTEYDHSGPRERVNPDMRTIENDIHRVEQRCAKKRGKMKRKEKEIHQIWLKN